MDIFLGSEVAEAIFGWTCVIAACAFVLTSLVGFIVYMVKEARRW